MKQPPKFATCKVCEDTYSPAHTSTEMYANMGVCSNACGAKIIEDRLREICPDFDVPPHLN